MLDELIEQFNKYNIDIPFRKGKYELIKKRKLDRQSNIIGVYNKETNKNYFDIYVEELFPLTEISLLILTLDFRDVKHRINVINDEEIINLIEIININIQTVNRLYNTLHKSLQQLKRTKNFHIFKYNKYIITVKKNFSLKISEYRETNEYTSLLINNTFESVYELLDFMENYDLLEDKNTKCCWCL